MEDFKQSLIDLGMNLEQAIGTDETLALLKAVSTFAQQCPDLCLELKEIVETTPFLKNELLTRKGANQLKQVVEIASNMDSSMIANFF